MPPRLIPGLMLAVALMAPAPVHGDTEGPAQTYVQSSTTDGTAYRGDRYAKCIPADQPRSQGRTLIFKVTADAADRLEDTYAWYSPELYLAGTSEGTLIARVSSSFGGHEPRKEDLALGLYFHGKPLKEYSALDLSKGRASVRTSVSHYQWCRRVVGYGWLTSPKAKSLRFGFALETMDGRLLCFDARTGEVLEGWGPPKLAT